MTSAYIQPGMPAPVLPSHHGRHVAQSYNVDPMALLARIERLEATVATLRTELDAVKPLVKLR